MDVSQSPSSVPSLWNMVTPMMTRTVLLKLYRIFTIPTRFEPAFAPIEHTIAVVTQSPRYMPTRTIYTVLKGISPAIENACRIPIEADEL